MTTVAAILDRYPQIPHTGRVVTTMTGGSNTAPWLIATQGGSFVLRRLPEYLGPARARFAAVHDHAARTLDVVPAVVVNGDGDLVTEHTGHHYLLAQRAPGNPLQQNGSSPAQCRRIGDVLGRLHQRLREMPPPPAGVPRQRVPTDVTAGIRAAAAVHDHPGCRHRSARQVLAVKLRRAQALRTADVDVLRALPVALVHGDFHPGNVLTVDGRVSAVLDFDLARLAPPAYELARALIYCTHPAATAAAWAPRVTAFLAGYLAVASMSRHELATMAALYETTQILDTYGLAVCEGVSPGLLAFGHARFALLYWLRRNTAVLTELAVEAHQNLTSEAGAR